MKSLNKIEAIYDPAARSEKELESDILSSASISSNEMSVIFDNFQVLELNKKNLSTVAKNIDQYEMSVMNVKIAFDASSKAYAELERRAVSSAKARVKYDIPEAVKSAYSGIQTDINSIEHYRKIFEDFPKPK